MVGALDTVLGPVARVSARLRWRDRLDACRLRLGIGRLSATVDPGLYALGVPDAGSPVLVSANYKLSFDHLRRALSGRHAWLLVLDTKGINVWCAAGKGTMGTGELAARLRASGLERLVSHRRVILPQLAGPGIAAQLLPRLTGFSACFGPVLAVDLPAYLEGGCRATPAMRRKRFPLAERLVLVPVEVVGAVRWSLPLLVVLALAAGGAGGAGYGANALAHGLAALLPYGAALAAGPVVTPLLLPWLPGRAFAVKGAVAGGLVAAAIFPLLPTAGLERTGGLLAVVALASYWGMRFTGASTYTSLSGVRKEMRWALPLQIVAGLVGLGCWLAGRLGG